MLPFLPSPISSAPAGHRARNEEMTGHITQSCTGRYRLKRSRVLTQDSNTFAPGLVGAYGVTCFQQHLANQDGRKEMRGVLKVKLQLN